MNCCLQFNLSDGYDTGCIEPNELGVLKLGRFDFKGEPGWFPRKTLEIAPSTVGGRTIWMICRVTTHDWIDISFYDKGHTQRTGQWRDVGYEPTAIDESTMIRVVMAQSRFIGKFIFYAMKSDDVSVVPQVWDSGLWISDDPMKRKPVVMDDQTTPFFLPEASKPVAVAPAHPAPTGKIAEGVAGFRAIADAFSTNPKGSVFALLSLMLMLTLVLNFPAVQNWVMPSATSTGK